MMGSVRRWALHAGVVLVVALIAANIAVRLLAPGQLFLVEFSRDEVINVPVEHAAVPGPGGSVLDTLIAKGSAIDPIILYFHGTKGRLPYIIEDASRYGTVIAPSFPGFGTSTGEPSERSVEQSVDAVFAWLEAQGTPASSVTVLGHSMGSYPAVYAAAHHAVGKLLLVNPLHSAQRTCGEHLAPLACLSTAFYFNAARLAPLVHAPTVVFHSTEDDVIPLADGHDLFDRIGSSDKRFVPIDGIHRQFNVSRVLAGGA